MSIQRVRDFGVAHIRQLSYSISILSVTLWTILRHINNGVNYDVVGQIGVSQQWAHGFMDGAQLGTTNYLLKMPFYFLVNGLHFLSPMNKLLFLAVVFNAATFVLLFVLFEKIMTLYNVQNRLWLYLTMGWLATIAGNVFWVDYANSRNLETVGGILFIFLLLKFIKQRRVSTLIWLGGSGGIVFFADPLQLYICGLGVCLYTIGWLVVRRTKAVALQTAGVITAVIIAYLFSQGLLLLAKTLLPVTFLTTANVRTPINITNLVGIFHGLGLNTLKIFGSDFFSTPHGINSIRESCNALVLILIVLLLLRLLTKKQPSNIRFTSGLLVTLIFTNYLVYTASGQVQAWGTSRYLIMVPLFSALLLIINADKFGGKYKQRLQYGWLLITAVSLLMLAGAFVNSWPNRHSKDTHIAATIAYMQQQKFKYALSSREVGVTTTYFSQGALTVLPMSCAPDHTLHPTNLFYDNAAFEGLYGYNREVPVLVPADGIKFGTICTRADIIAQFGKPQREMPYPGGGTAIIYKVTSLHMADITTLVNHKKVN